jgi:hypothetical protein
MCNKLAVDLCDLAGVPLNVEKVTSHFLAFDGKTLRFRAILQRVNDCVGNGSRISRGYEPAGHAFLNDVGEAPDICAYHRNPAEKGFDGCVGHILCVRGDHS